MAGMRLAFGGIMGAAVAVVGMLPQRAAAQQAQQSLHDIPWYQAHAQAREATMRLCHSDHRFEHDVDCKNAETAGTLDWGRRSAQATPSGHGNQLFPELADPRYWAANRLSRIGVIAACRGKSVYTAETCAAARQGDTLDPRGHP